MLSLSLRALRRRSRFSLLLAAIPAALLTTAAPASADLPWAGCTPAGFQCTQLAVPLDRTGAVPGTVNLAATRLPAASNPTRTAVVTLAGGPGQAAMPFASDFATEFKATLADKDLLVFDQRGTGKSGELSCPALRRSARSLVDAVQACSLEIGARRAFYTTAQSVDDLEALRVAGGYDKLVLFGVSYGTKVALAYAAAHPANVSALILDSVVTPEGPDALQRSTFASVPRVIGSDLCGNNACASFTKDAVADLQTFAAKLAKRSIKGAVYSGSGKRYTAKLSVNGLVEVLSAGDLNPALRSELPAAVASALKGDNGPILRLSARSAGLDNASVRLGRAAAATGTKLATVDEAADDSLYLATICEENTTFPWTRGATVTQRAQELASNVSAQPAGTFGIFPSSVGLEGFSAACLGWSVASAAPAAPGALPNVPTLILDGQADTRTPVEDAQNVAARIPLAQVVTIPHTGHSVLSAELGTCAQTALTTFLQGGAPGACPASNEYFAPSGRAPRTLSMVRRAGGLPSRAGRTLNALAASLYDARLEIVGDSIATGALPKAIGGLRGGSVRVKSQRSWTFRDYEYVPGVRVSGSYRENGTSTFTFSGRSTARGTVKILKSGRATGRLDGRKVDAKPRATAAAVEPSLPTVAKALAVGQRRAGL